MRFVVRGKIHYAWGYERRVRKPSGEPRVPGLLHRFQLRAGGEVLDDQIMTTEEITRRVLAELPRAELIVLHVGEAAGAAGPLAEVLELPLPRRKKVADAA